MKKEFILNEKNLKQIGACKEGIDFACINFNNMNYYDLKIKGDHNNFKGWLEDALKNNYTYGDKGNMLSKTYPSGRVYTYTYDSKGNMLSKTTPFWGTITYTYDEKGNMISKTYPSGKTYTYDDKGNMISMTYPDGGTSTYTYTYDSKGNMLSKTYPSGRVYTYTYAYDSSDRLIAIKENNEIICEIGYKERA